MKTHKHRNLSILMMLAGLSMIGNTRANGTWKQVQSREGITIYERWVMLPGNKQARERKGEMVVTSSMSMVINTLCDPSRSKEWMENVSEAYLMRKTADSEWISYTQFSLPWPLDKRDLVTVSKLKYITSQRVRIDISSAESSLGPLSNAKRINDYKAAWEIVDRGQGNIAISFSTLSYQAPEFPRVVHDPVVRNAFLRNLMKLKLVLSV